MQNTAARTPKRLEHTIKPVNHNKLLLCGRTSVCNGQNTLLLAVCALPIPLTFPIVLILSVSSPFFLSPTYTFHSLWTRVFRPLLFRLLAHSLSSSPRHTLCLPPLLSHSFIRLTLILRQILRHCTPIYHGSRMKIHHPKISVFCYNVLTSRCFSSSIISCTCFFVVVSRNIFHHSTVFAKAID